MGDQIRNAELNCSAWEGCSRTPNLCLRARHC